MIATGQQCYWVLLSVKLECDHKLRQMTCWLIARWDRSYHWSAVSRP
jgi:hypothetical protein